MSVNTIADMHSDHRCWNNEHALWREEVNLWRKELQQAQADLNLLANILRDHEGALDAHLEAINQHEAIERKHEHALATGEGGVAIEATEQMTSTHQREGERHRLNREAHERIKKHQHTLMARWSLFLKALGEAM